MQYDRDGQPDETFGNGGVAVPPFASGGIAVQSDGDIVVAGSVAGEVALARLDPQGDTDATFGTEGLVTTDFGLLDGAFPATEFGRDVAIEPDGHIVVVGTSQANGSGDLAVVGTTPRAPRIGALTATASSPSTSPAGSTPATTWRCNPTARSSPSAARSAASPCERRWSA